MKVTLDIDLEKLRYSLVGDGYILEEVKEMTNEELITILTGRIERHIEIEYDKSKRWGYIN